MIDKQRIQLLYHVGAAGKINPFYTAVDKHYLYMTDLKWGVVVPRDIVPLAQSQATENFRRVTEKFNMKAIAARILRTFMKQDGVPCSVSENLGKGLVKDHYGMPHKFNGQYLDFFCGMFPAADLVIEKDNPNPPMYFIENHGHLTKNIQYGGLLPLLKTDGKEVR